MKFSEKIKKYTERLKMYGELHLGAYALFSGAMCKLGGIPGEYWDMNLRRKIVKKLRKKYKKQLCAFSEEIEKNDKTLDHGRENIVWVCWFQGIENAPPIVKACYRSLCRELSGKQIVVITRENYGQYTSLPPFIIDRFEKGTIAPAVFSDVLRTDLLTRHGGTWIDATVFVSGKIPSYMLESDLFLFRISGSDRAMQATSMENWFISACRNEKALLLAQKMLYHYYEHHKRAAEYFLWYDFMELAIERFPDAWSSAPPVTREASDHLLSILFEPYREDVWEIVTANTPIHKLTYRYSYIFDMPEQEVQDALARTDTFHAHILDENL